MSFIRRKSFSFFKGRVLQCESQSYGLFQGNLCPKIYIHSTCVYKQDHESFAGKSNKPEEVKEDFGRVVDLGEDFNTVEKKNKRLKKSKKGASFSTETSVESSESLQSNDELTGKTNKKTSSKLLTSYETVSSNNKIFSSLMSALKTSKKRDERKEIFLEGKRLIFDAVAAGLVPKKVFFTRRNNLEELGLPKETLLFRISYKTCKLWSDTETSQGVIGVFDISSLENLKPQTDCMPLTIICDNIRDPGNLGSLLRVAAGAGCEKIILTKGCTDVWSSKVLRSAAGAHFHFPILRNLTWPEIEAQVYNESDIFVADGNCSGEKVNEKDFKSSVFKNESHENLPKISSFSAEFKKKNTAFVFGGETHGISREAYVFAQQRNGKRIFIPMDNKVESLNVAVALGILIYEFKRQLNCLNENS